MPAVAQRLGDHPAARCARSRRRRARPSPAAVKCWRCSSWADDQHAPDVVEQDAAGRRRCPGRSRAITRSVIDGQRQWPSRAPAVASSSSASGERSRPFDPNSSSVGPRMPIAPTTSPPPARTGAAAPASPLAYSSTVARPAALPGLPEMLGECRRRRTGAPRARRAGPARRAAVSPSARTPAGTCPARWRAAALPRRTDLLRRVVGPEDVVYDAAPHGDRARRALRRLPYCAASASAQFIAAARRSLPVHGAVPGAAGRPRAGSVPSPRPGRRSRRRAACGRCRARWGAAGRATRRCSLQPEGPVGAAEQAEDRRGALDRLDVPARTTDTTA